MLRTIEGVFHQGRVDLLESPKGFRGDVSVIVTFLTEADGVDLRSRGIDSAQAADLRGRLGSFREDWDDPSMDIYDEQYGSIRL
jgi:hypothetical protein